MPAHLRLARPFRVRTVTVLAASLIAAAPGAFAQLASGAPRPVRSADLSALEAEISATPAQRKSFGEAMDRYVARWQKLRDGDLAKAIRAEDDVTIAQVDSFREFEPNAEPPQPDPEADRRRADAGAQMRAARTRAPSSRPAPPACPVCPAPRARPALRTCPAPACLCCCGPTSTHCGPTSTHRGPTTPRRKGSAR
jgi:hypothetical protein